MQKETACLKLIEWFTNGQVGESSRTMAAVAFGIIPKNPSWPLDVGDFIRCYQLLQNVPEIKSEFPRIAGISKEWGNLIAVWDKIEAAYLKERLMGRPHNSISYPKTHKLILKAITQTT